jgi:hypothetical protein
MRKADDVEQCKNWKVDIIMELVLRTAENHKNKKETAISLVQTRFKFRLLACTHTSLNVHTTVMVCTYLCDKVAYKGYVGVTTQPALLYVLHHWHNTTSTQEIHHAIQQHFSHLQLHNS